MISISKDDGIPDFSVLKGSPGSVVDPPRAELMPLGRIIIAHLYGLKKKYPHVKIIRRSIMPDHIHFIIFITESGICHLGDIICDFERECTREYAAQIGVPPDTVSVFKEKYHDRILRGRNQLSVLIRYVVDNPRRRLERLAAGGYTRRVFLEDTDANRYEAYGNLSLLADPEKVVVRFSRRFTSAEIREHKLRWIEVVQNGGVLVSPFIHSEERKAFDWAAENGGKFIYICDNGFGERYSPKGRLHQLCIEGRLLLIGPCEHLTAKVALTREQCMRMNQLAEIICDGGLRPLQ